MSEQIDVLEEARLLIGGDRRDDYGPALDSFNDIATGWSVIIGVPVSAEQVALAMDWLKTCRALNDVRQGRAIKRDSIVDKCGYSGLLEVMQQERAQRAEDEAWRAAQRFEVEL